MGDDSYLQILCGDTISHAYDKPCLISLFHCLYNKSTNPIGDVQIKRFIALHAVIALLYNYLHRT